MSASDPQQPLSQDDDSTSQQITEQDPSGPVKAEDSMDTLVLELHNSIAGPDKVVESGRAPVPYFFGFQPPADRQDQVKAFAGLLGMSAVIRMFAAMNIVTARKARKQEQAYSITKPNEYLEAFNEGTDATVAAITRGPLAGFYGSSGGGTTQTENVQLKRSELHKFVLPRIFGGLSQIGPDQMKALDVALTHFVSLLKPYKAASSTDPDDTTTALTTTTERPPQPQLKHVVLIQYVRATDITGSGDVFVYDACTRMVNISIGVDDWSTALRKPGFLSKNEKIKFTMARTTVDFKLDEAKFSAAKPKYEQAMKLTVDGHDDMKKIMDEGGLEGFGRATCTVKDACVDDTTKYGT